MVKLSWEIILFWNVFWSLCLTSQGKFDSVIGVEFVALVTKSLQQQVITGNETPPTILLYFLQLYEISLDICIIDQIYW